MCLGLPSQSSAAPGLEQDGQSPPEMEQSYVSQGLPWEVAKVCSRVCQSYIEKGKKKLGNKVQFCVVTQSKNLN